MESPASPNILSTIIFFTAFSASSKFLQIMTPFPAAKPSAFITVGKLIDFKYSKASEELLNTLKSAVGILYFFIRFLAKTLLPSKIAPSFEGPKILRLCF